MTLQERLKRAESGRTILYKGSDGSVTYRGDNGAALPTVPSSSLEDQHLAEQLGAQRDNEAGFQNWTQEMDQFMAQAQNDRQQRNGIWQSEDVYDDYRKKQDESIARLQQQANSYLNFFSANRDVYGDETVDRILSAIDRGGRRLANVHKSLDDEGSFRGQFLDQGEFDTYYKLQRADAAELKQWNEELGEEIKELEQQLRGHTKYDLMNATALFPEDVQAYYDRQEMQDSLDRKKQTRNRVLNRYYQVDNEQKLANLERNGKAMALYQIAGSDAASRTAREDAIQALSDMGYDYNRLAQYRQTQADAARYREQQEEIAEETRAHPWISTGISILASPFQGLNYLDQAVRALTQGSPDDIESYVPLNPYNMGAANYVSGVQGTTAEGIEKMFPNAELFGVNVPSFAYQTGTSILNSAYQVGLMGPASVVSMGGAAAANQMQDIIARGGSNQQALLGGTAAGIAEVLFEKLSIDQLLKPKSVTGWKSLVKETAKQAGIEASEEAFTEIANILSDTAVMGRDSSAELAVRAYMMQGMSEEEARKQLFFDQLGQVAEAAAGGALSGGVMGGASSAVNYALGGGQYNAVEQANPLEQAVREMFGLETEQGGPQEGAQATVQYHQPETRTAQEGAQGAAEDAQRTRADTEIVGRDDPARRSAGSGHVTDGAPSGRALQTDTAARDITAQQRAAAMENAGALVRASEVFGENGRKAFAAAWDGQGDSSRYYAGFATWYQAGLDGKAESQVRGPYAGAVNEAQRVAAYDSGKRDAAASLAKEKAAAPYARTAGTEAGLVYDEYVAQAVEGEGGKLTADTAERMNQAAKALGVRVRLVDHIDAGTTGANGDIRGSDILIAKDAADPVAQVYGHEITHRVQELAPEQYRVFRQAALENMADSAVQAKLDNYRAQGENLLYEKAMDDVAADYAGRLLEDGAVLDQFIERHRTDRSLLEKLRDVFRGLWQKLTGAERRKAQTAEGKLAAALDAAAEQAKTLTETGEGHNAEGDVKYSIKYDRDNTPYVIVETDILKDVPPSEWARTVKDNLRKKFPNGITVGNNVVKITRKSWGELTHSKYTMQLSRENPQMHSDKLRATDSTDEIMQTAQNWVNEAPLHPRNDDIIDFARGTVQIRIGGNDYTADVVVGNRGKDGLLLYDIIDLLPAQIQDRTEKTGAADTAAPSIAEGQHDRQTAPITDSVPQPGGESKPQYSLKGATITKTYNQLLRENDALRERVEYWRGQTRQTKEVTVDKKAVNAAAKDIVKEYGAQLDAGELSGRLQALYDHMARTWYDKGETEGSDVWKGAEEIAKDIAGSAVKEFSLAEEFPGLKEKLRDTPITIGHEYDNDLHNENFRRDYRGKLKLSSQGPTNVDAVYAELSESYPGLFPEDITHPADQMEQIMDVVDSLSSVERQARFSGQMEEAVMGITNEIMGQFLGMPLTRATFADRQNAKLDKLRAENKQAVQEAIARERAAREKQVNELKDKYKARTEEGREKQSAAELRRKITRHAKGLSDKLLHPTDKAHIPEELRGPVAKVLESINLESQYTVDPETVKRTKGGSGDPVKRTQAFLELKQKYAEINKNGGDLVIDPALLGSDTEGVQGSLDAVIAMGDTPISAMNSKQLSTVWQVLKSVEHSVSTAGKLLNQGKYQRTAEWADALRQDTATRRKRTGDGRLRLDLENPYTYFSHYGQAGKDMYRTLRNAQDHQQVLTNRVADGVSQVVDEKTAKKLEKTSHDYTTENGQKLTLSTAQVMELYELSKRKQARDHLLIGGIVQPEIRGTKVRRGTEAIRLTVNDLADITGTLTAEEKGRV